MLGEAKERSIALKQKERQGQRVVEVEERTYRIKFEELHCE